MNRFFDFHCHPGLKPCFSRPGQQPSPWENLKAVVETPVGEIEMNPLFNEVLDSQSSLQQLYNGNVNLIGLVISAAESNMGKSLWERSIVRDNKVSLIWPGQVERIMSGSNYYELTREEMDHLLAHREAPDSLPGGQLKFIRSYQEYDPADINTIHAFVVVEGLHCFSPDEVCTDNWSRLRQNFREFVSNPAYRVFVINPCHLQQNKICNHAHGIQFFRPEWFYPTGETFSGEGEQMIREIYNNNILVDIKHMSLAARKSFYLQHQAEFPDRPILCTHAGITGLAMQECTRYLSRKPEKTGVVWRCDHFKPQGYLPHSFFNCSSINLYDQDIAEILDSRGLIGISLDQRILGFGAAYQNHWLVDPVDTEFINENESSGFFGPQGASGQQIRHWRDGEVLDGEEQERQASTAAIGELHQRYFFNNIIHILEVAREHGMSYSQASRHICIGSDFDGLIDAVECCKTTTGLADFHRNLLAGARQYFREAGYSRIPVDPAMLMDNIFYENGRRFLEEWY